MSDAENTETFASISELCALFAESKKPIAIWIGAGASAWAGLPLWPQLAEFFHKEYSRFEPAYNKKTGNEFISEALFPDFFSYCKQINETRFNSLLIASLRVPTNPPPVYARFISALKAIKRPLQILTTNVDEGLEQNLQLPVILPTDLERLKTLIHNGEPFIAKLHGSISAINSTTFTKKDYDALKKNSARIDSIKTVFDLCSVLFIGYGLQDDYVIKIIRQVEDFSVFFGTGPHFAAISSDGSELPSSVRKINYIRQPHTDHRASIQIIEELNRANRPKATPKETSSAMEVCSAHFLSDIFPAGTWQTAQTVHATSTDGDRKIRFIVGHGLTESEIPFTFSTALHDLVVGLICFEKVYAPLSTLGRLFALIGESMVTELVNSEILCFVYLKGDEAIIFAEEDTFTGYLATIQPGQIALGEREFTQLDFIRRQLTPTIGREKEAEEMFGRINQKVINLPTEPEIIPSIVHNLLLRPSVRQMLGVSDAAKLSLIPAWIQFPILRLAQVIRIGLACRDLHIASVKFEFGNDKLAGPVFAAAAGNEFASNLASYVLAGNFSTDLGTFVQENPSILPTILKFRESAQGDQLRKEILAHLIISSGGEFAASVNAGLKSVIPLKILEQARSNFAQLSITNRPANYPAVWNDANYGNKALSLWKKRSREEFQQICNKLHLTPYDFCPCGSGEKIKFCCAASLT